MFRMQETAQSTVRFYNINCDLGRVVDSYQRLGAPPVVAVLARHHGLPLGLLLHEDLVDTPANTSHLSVSH